MSNPLRDIDGDYKRAYIAEYEAYASSGRKGEAARIAGILRDHYGHDVDPKERADEQAPEDTAEPSPKKRGGRPRLPRDADGNIIR